MKRRSTKEKIYTVKRVLIYFFSTFLIVSVVYLIGLTGDFSLIRTEQSHKFGASYMTMNNPYFGMINASISSIVESNGDVLITRDPALDAERQVEQIYQMIDEGIEALFVAPVDYEKIVPVIQAAKKRGIIVIFVDTEAEDDSLADGAVVSNNYEAGKICAQYLMLTKESASIVLFEHKRTKSGNDRIQGFLETLQGNENYKVVYREDAQGQVEIAMPKMQKILESGVEFDTVFAINDVSALGAMAALQDANRLSETTVFGVDGTPEAKAMIKENIMTATVAQYPNKIGEYAAERLYKILDGEEVANKRLVPVYLITKDNVDDFGTHKWQ